MNTILKGKKVLLTEDDKFFRDLIGRKLTESGFDVTYAQDGETAITALSSLVPDLIILDIMLPKIDGFAVLGEVRKIESLKKTPVIFLSNLGSHDDIEKGKSLGVNSFLIKATVIPDEIISEVNKVLSSVK